MVSVLFNDPTQERIAEPVAAKGMKDQINKGIEEPDFQDKARHGSGTFWTLARDEGQGHRERSRDGCGTEKADEPPNMSDHLRFIPECTPLEPSPVISHFVSWNVSLGGAR